MAKENPTNMASQDIAKTLVLASGALVEAQEGLEAARQPIRDAKASVKATGIDFDIFNLVHKIRHLDDDDQRQKRISKLQVAVSALLGDKVQLDMFGFVTPTVKAQVKEALREASDTLQKEEPVEQTQAEQEPDLPFDADRPKVEEQEEDLPALVAAADVPEGAGHIANNGYQAGYQFFEADSNPHEPGSIEYGIWEKGRQRGWATAEAEGQGASDAQDGEETEQQEPQAGQPAEDTGKKGSVSAEMKRAEAYFHGYDNADSSDLAELTKGRRGEIKARIEAGFKDRNDGAEPRYARPAAKAPEETNVPRSGLNIAPDLAPVGVLSTPAGALH